MFTKAFLAEASQFRATTQESPAAKFGEALGLGIEERRGILDIFTRALRAGARPIGERIIEFEKLPLAEQSEFLAFGATEPLKNVGVSKKIVQEAFEQQRDIVAQQVFKLKDKIFELSRKGRNLIAAQDFSDIASKIEKRLDTPEDLRNATEIERLFGFDVFKPTQGVTIYRLLRPVEDIVRKVLPEPETQAGLSSTVTPSLMRSKKETSFDIAGRRVPSDSTTSTSQFPGFVKSTSQSLSSNRTNFLNEFAIRNLDITSTKPILSRFQETVKSLKPSFLDMSYRAAQQFNGEVAFRIKDMESIGRKMTYKGKTIGEIDDVFGSTILVKEQDKAGAVKFLQVVRDKKYSFF